MKKKTAVLLDLGFVLVKLKATLGRFPTANDIHGYALKCIEADEELFRIYCYHCQPFAQTITHPLTGAPVNFSTTQMYRDATRLITDLKVKDNVAYRSGELSFQGWILNKWAVRSILATPRALVATDFRPDLKQKGVDMKIGLDVAWLASKSIVERIVLVTADSDFISPMKFARREGVQIILITMGHTQIKRELKEHADILRTVVYP
jgi:uncharacterized LabA/DUF88 family protein